MTAHGPERRGPERPGPDYPAEWDQEPEEHDWMQFGGPGDEWRECFLCGQQEDL